MARITSERASDGGTATALSSWLAEEDRRVARAEGPGAARQRAADLGLLSPISSAAGSSSCRYRGGSISTRWDGFAGRRAAPGSRRRASSIRCATSTPVSSALVTCPRPGSSSARRRSYAVAASSAGGPAWNGPAPRPGDSGARRTASWRRSRSAIAGSASSGRRTAARGRPSRPGSGDRSPRRRSSPRCARSVLASRRDALRYRVGSPPGPCAPPSSRLCPAGWQARPPRPPGQRAPPPASTGA